MEIRCDICNRNFNSEESLKQHNEMKHPIKEKKKLNIRKYIIISLFLLIILFSIFTITSYMKKPGDYD